jgi:hypothetical protein
MAQTISTRVSNDTRQPFMMTDNDNYHDDAEESTVRKLFANEPEIGKDSEWTMLMKLATTDSDDDVNIVEIHRHILELMQQADPTVCFMAADCSKIEQAENFPTGNAYKTKFRIKETRKQFLVAHPVRSEKNLDEIKRNHPELLEFLKIKNVYIDLSATGSLAEVVLGPWLGVHPDFTSKRRFKNDLIKLIAVHTTWNPHKNELLRKAKERLTFPGVLPTFQLRTRRIRREINDVEYTAKASVFICAVEHRDFWEEVLVDGMAEGFLLSLGRFYLLKRDDRSPALKTAITWHNKMLNSMKAIVIRGISNSVMDACVRPPHSDEEQPSLRQKLHQGGFLTIISSNEPNKWIGIAQDADIATNYVNRNMRDLCAVAYDDGTSPSASIPGRRDRHHPTDGLNDDKSALFSKQTKSWADIAGQETDEASNTHTDSNIARRPPRNVQFRSRIRFDIQEVAIEHDKPDDETKITANDALTALTHDDLKSLKDELRAQFKDEISTAISEMSIPSNHVHSNDAFQLEITNQMKEHNREMKAQMLAMQNMMLSMKRFVENAMPDIRSQKSDDSACSNDTNFQDVTTFQSDTEMRNQNHSSDQDSEPEFITQPAKRRAAHSKGESPSAKRTQTREHDARRGGGRSSGRGRGGRSDASITNASNTSRRSNRIRHQNSYEPLTTTGDALSSSGSI